MKKKAELGHSHETLEVIKIAVVLDGDLAMTLGNLVAFCDEHNFLDDLVFCETVYPKLQALMERLEGRLDIENRSEP